MAEKKGFIENIYGENVFSLAVMKERLSEEAFLELERVRNGEGELSLKTANEVAEAMKNWALEKGATHYCHWFQPLTGITAEKQDAFLATPGEQGVAISKFSGKNLVKGESDASSFPSGGLRATFEARGYTVWDCTSPAFIREDKAGVILYIPTAFCSYKGEALDKKTPLLRSTKVLNEQALRLLRLFGNQTAKKVVASSGAEQEYFLVDRNLYLQREDLMFAGRTLFGAVPPKCQEMGDHYLGTIPERVAMFMKDVNKELWKLGVPAKTQHNEAAPAQHELAPIFEECNIATDHNQLVMETLKKVAGRHDLSCLLNEKPFDHMNGSGKHNNWSLATDDGHRMFDPGKNPHENLEFLLFLTCMMKAVDEHADLLIESAMDVGNENRLGGNEAPPCIISIFLGEQLTDVLEQFVSNGSATSSMTGKTFSPGVSSLAQFDTDVSDRNRTSPFAFTGNKFEFRSVGSKDSIAKPNIVLNTIAAEAFEEAADILEKAEDFETAVRGLIKKYAEEHSRIVFNGNNYAAAWVEEAKKRGLPIVNNMVEAISALKTEKAAKLFGKYGIYTPAELASRAEIKYDTYAKAIHIEAQTMIDMAGRLYIPAVIHSISETAESAQRVKRAVSGAYTGVQEKLVKKYSTLLKEAEIALETLEKVTAEATALKNPVERAEAYRDKVRPAMKALRKPIDELERITDKAYWPVPTYSELIFEV